MNINLIWAQARNRVIGREGTIPWRLPEDLARLKALTLGCPVIMGRKTWDSLPAKFRPLPGRLNVVLTRSAVWSEIGACPTSDLHEALRLCEQNTDPNQNVWVLGGAQVYAQALPLAQRLEVTEIEADFAGDALAPQLPAHWQETSRTRHLSATGLAYSFVTYQRHD